MGIEMPTSPTMTEDPVKSALREPDRFEPGAIEYLKQSIATIFAIKP